MPKNTQFKIGNKAAKKNPRIIIRKMLEMLEKANSDNTILCFQDACYAANVRNTKIDYWAEKNAVFGKLKKEIQNSIIRRINSNALKGERAGGYAGTASIWRMKQLGEKDQLANTDTKVNLTVNNSPISEEPTDELIKRAQAVKIIEGAE